MKKISILLPCYNGQKYLEQAIQSVINQDYTNWELIIIDGKSIDGTHAIISKYCAKDQRIVWLKYDSSNFSDKLNQALGVATGNVIGYMGFDDYYRQGIFKEVADFLENHPKAAWIYGNSYNVYPYDKTKLLLIKPPKRLYYTTLFLGNVVGLQNCFFDKDMLLSAKFAPENKYSQDFELYFRLIKKYQPVYLNTIISYNTQDNNLSSGPMSPAQKIEAQDVAKKNAKTMFHKALFSLSKFPVIGSVVFRLCKLLLSL